MVKRRKKQKLKVIYKNLKPSVPVIKDETPALKNEIKDLEAKKAQAPKGFKGFLYKAQINKAISDKRNYIRSREGSRNLKVATQNLSDRIEYERKKNELQELRKKNEVRFDGFGFSGSAPRKELKFEDLV